MKGKGLGFKIQLENNCGTAWDGGASSLEQAFVVSSALMVLHGALLEVCHQCSLRAQQASGAWQKGGVLVVFRAECHGPQSAKEAHWVRGLGVVR